MNGKQETSMMKETQLIGNILEDGEGISHPTALERGDPVKLQFRGIVHARSSSAPPSISEDAAVPSPRRAQYSELALENISPEDPRLDPNYYACLLYTSPSPRD
eukprot:TRINITY_DN223_c0_g1_i5.p1 TRINITY_DN223_c0_g1~~TRINITY_DN223_c0_g1_i5.p1  ORF type:complete len:104 (+),score=9.54 TRINITY_DN223_c0_g1_i5:99-410(+)